MTAWHTKLNYAQFNYLYLIINVMPLPGLTIEYCSNPYIQGYCVKQGNELPFLYKAALFTAIFPKPFKMPSETSTSDLPCSYDVSSGSTE